MCIAFSEAPKAPSADHFQTLMPLQRSQITDLNPCMGSRNSFLILRGLGHTSSIGTPRVSGSKKTTKSSAMNCQKPKKMNCIAAAWSLVYTWAAGPSAKDMCNDKHFSIRTLYTEICITRHLFPIDPQPRSTTCKAGSRPGPYHAIPHTAHHCQLQTQPRLSSSS